MYLLIHFGITYIVFLLTFGPQGRSGLVLGRGDAGSSWTHGSVTHCDTVLVPFLHAVGTFFLPT